MPNNLTDEEYYRRAMEAKLNSKNEGTAKAARKYMESQKFYKGDTPTATETLAQIYRIGQKDESRASKLYDDYMTYTQDATTPLYNPYTQATAKGISELGLDARTGVDDSFFDQFSLMRGDYRYTDSGTSPAAPSKSSTPEQNAAYWYYKLLGNEETTKKAESEWQSLQNEIHYWASRSDRNMSDEEIMRSIDWSKYSALERMDEGKRSGNPLQLNRPVGYSQDAMYGVMWAARNPDLATGNAMNDAVMAQLGRGNAFARNDEVTQKLDPTSEYYNPYSLGSTLDDAAAYFGMSGFDDAWLEENRGYLATDNEQDRKMWQKAYDANETTKSAQAELSALWDEVTMQINAGISAEDILDGGLDAIMDGTEASVKTLKAMDEGLKRGSPVELTSAVDYSWNDFSREVSRLCAERDEKAQHQQYLKELGDELGVQLIPSQSEEAINDVQFFNVQKSSKTILHNGTPAEKAVFAYAGNPSYTSGVKKIYAISAPEAASGQRAYDAMLRSTNQFTEENYEKAHEKAAPYLQGEAILEETRAKLASTEDPEEKKRLENLIQHYEESLAKVRPLYEEALSTLELIEEKKAVTERIRTVAGLPEQPAESQQAEEKPKENAFWKRAKEIVLTDLATMYDSTIGWFTGTTVEGLTAEDKANNAQGVSLGDFLLAFGYQVGGNFNDFLLGIGENYTEWAKDFGSVVGLDPNEAWNPATELRVKNAEKMARGMQAYSENATWGQRLFFNTLTSAANSAIMAYMGGAIGQAAGAAMSGGAAGVNTLAKAGQIGSATQAIQMTPFALQSATEAYDKAEENGLSGWKAAASAITAGLMSLAANSETYDDFMTKRFGLGSPEDAARLAMESGEKLAQMSANAYPWMMDVLMGMSVGEGVQEVVESLTLKLNDDMYAGTLLDAEGWNEWTNEARQEFVMGYLSGALFSTVDKAAESMSRKLLGDMMDGEIETNADTITDYMVAVAQETPQEAVQAAPDGKLDDLSNSTEKTPQGVTDEQKRASAAAKAVALEKAIDTQDEATQTEAVAGALLADESDEAMAESTAAAVTMSEKYGAKRSARAVRDTLLVAAENDMDAEAVREAVSIAAIGEGEAALVLDAVVSEANAQNVSALVEAAQKDKQNPEVLARADNAMLESEIATRTKELIADGALNGADSYETAVKQASANLRNAQEQLTSAKAKLEASGKNLQVVQTQHLNDPSNMATRGAVIQATKDVEGAAVVVKQMEGSVRNYEEQVKQNKHKRDSIVNEMLNGIRKQAREEVLARREQAAQQKQEAAAQADAQRQADNVTSVEADNFIDERYPEANDEQRDMMRDLYAKSRKGKAPEGFENGVNLLTRLGKKFGFNVRLVDGETVDGAEGKYESDTNTIFVPKGITQTEAVKRVILHEMTHVSERSGKAYSDFQDAILAWYYKGNEALQKADIASTIARYNSYYERTGNEKRLDETGAKKELAAQINELIFETKDPEFINRLCAEEPSVAQRIWQTIKDIVNKLRGVNDPAVDQLRQVEKLFEKALGKANSSGVDGEQYSVPKERLTDSEWKMFYDKIGEIKIGKDAQFQNAANGDKIFAINNKLVYTDGNWDKPSISSIVEILTDDEFDIETVRDIIYAYESAKRPYAQAVELCKDLFEMEIVSRKDYGTSVSNQFRSRGSARGESGRTPSANRNGTHFSLPSPEILNKEIAEYDPLPTDPNTTRPSGRKLGERQFATKTAQESRAMPEAIKAELLSNKEAHYYEIDSNRAQLQRSWDRLNAEGYEGITARLLGNTELPTADDVADANMLMAVANKFGDMKTLLDVALKYDVEGTEQAKAMQARSIFKRMTPTGIQAFAAGQNERKLNEYMETHKGHTAQMKESAKKVADSISDLQGGDETLRAFEAGEYTIDASNNQYGQPVNEQQMALIKAYGLEKVKRPGALYNWATTKQRMLEEILATPNPMEKTGLGLNLVERLEFMKNNLAVTTSVDLKYLGSQLTIYANASEEDQNGRLGDLALSRAAEAFGNIDPATVGEKVRPWRYTSMLLSLPSALRNAIGNAGGMVLSQASHDMAAVLDAAISGATGKERTTALLTMKERAEGWRAFKEETKNTFRDYFVDKTITARGQGRYDLTQKSRRGRTFQSNALEGARHVEGFMMSFADRNVWKRAYANSMIEQQKLARLNGNDFDVTAAEAQAEADANYAVYAEDNKISKILGELKRAIPLLDYIIPFTGVPTNIASRMWQYSPMGLTQKAIVEPLVNKAKHKDFDQKSFVDGVARGLTGTALLALGAALFGARMIDLGYGDEEKEKVSGVRTAQGDQYSPFIRVGDYTFNLSPFAPAVAPIIMGAQVANLWKDDTDKVSAFYNGCIASLAQITDASFMANIQNIVGGYGSEAIVTNAFREVGKSILTQMVPSPISQLADALDPYVRDTKDKNMMMEALYEVANKIPGMRNLLPEKVDVAGRTVKSKSPLSAFLNPFSTTEAKDDPVLDEMQRLYEVTGSTSHMPSDALNGRKNEFQSAAYDGIKIGKKAKEAYKKRYGELWYYGGTTYTKKGKQKAFVGALELMQSNEYHLMSDAEKAKALSKIMEYAKEGAQYETVNGR